jgi:DNA mismatch repair protein MutS2
MLDVHKRAAATSDKKPAKPTAVVAAPAAVELAASADQRAGARTPERTLDLRGERVDEALAKIDRFLDESVTLNRDIVFIVHGHGTGALRSAIREHVKRNPSIAKSRAGEPNEGGDGVTVLFLKD